ncbi:MAG: hypothetical protein M3Q45_10165, partial [Chloroflexota bacterium]|nr:hypothetical protein [Chloroflexota bacterium]
DGEVETVHIDPDTFAEISSDAATSHPYKLVMPRELLDQIEAMPEHEAEDLMRAIASLADNPKPPGAKRLAGDGLRDEE